MKLPKHLAIIMDGNGRWAQARGRSRFWGHIKGALAAKKIVEACASAKLENLTLFTFSTENWKRPTEEVDFLMKLLIKRLGKELPTLTKNNICFKAIGDLNMLPLAVRSILEKTVQATKSNTGMNLVFALSYGGRSEIVSAAKQLAELVQAGKLQPEQIDETLFSSSLESSFLPDADLIIRTSGECRLSNFYLWQSAYSEIYFTPEMWPDFSAEHLQKAFAWYGSSERRFGCTGQQISKEIHASLN